MLKIYLIVMGLYAIGYAFLRWSATRTIRPYIGPRFFIGLALTTLAVLMSPSGTIYGFACILIFVATVRNRMDAACRITMMGLLAPTIKTPLVVGSLFLIQCETVGFLVVGFALSLLITRSREAGKSRPVRGLTAEDAIVAILFLSFWIGVTRFPSWTILARAGVETALLTPIPYLLFRNSIRSVRDVRLVMACMAAATLLTSFIAFYESRMKWLPIQLMASHINVGEYGLSMLFRGNLLRPLTSTGNALVLASALVMGFVAAACSRDMFRNAFRYRLALGILLITLVLAQSRGNLIVLGLAGIVVLGLSGRKLLAGAVAVGALIVYEGLFALASRSAQVAAFLGVGDSSSRFAGHFDYRGYLLQRGLEEGAKHRWLGTSMENLLSNMTDLIQGQHIVDFVNTYLVIYLVSGLVGLGSLVLFMLLALRGLVRTKVARKSELAWARALVTAAFVAIAVELTFMSYIGCIPMLVVLTLACSRTLRLDARRHMAAERSEAAKMVALPT